jgi:hypothetical protein
MSVYRQLAERRVAKPRPSLWINNNLGHMHGPHGTANYAKNILKGIKHDMKMYR